MVLVLLLLGGGAASAQSRMFGLGVGAAVELDPAGDTDLHAGTGASFVASAAMRFTEDGVGSLLWLSGRLIGVVTDKGSWAAMPTLGADIGGAIGPVELFINGGVQLFGFAHRSSETIFAFFGLTTGAGVGVMLGEGWRVSLRSDLTWLPSPFSAPVDNPEMDPNNTFLFISALLSVEVRSNLDL